MSKVEKFACIAHGFIFLASIDEKLCIMVRIYRMSLASREIVNHDSDSLHLQLKSDYEAQIVHFKSCVDPDTGLILPVLVILIKGNFERGKTRSAASDEVEATSSRFYYFGIQYDPNSKYKKEILPLRYYQVNDNILKETVFSKDMLLVWTKNRLLHIAVSSPHNKTVLCEHTFKIGKHCENVTKEQIIWAGKPSGIWQDCCVVLSRVTVTDETISDDDLFLENHVSEKKSFSLIILVQTTDGQWCQQELHVSDIIPEIYSANLLALSVISCKVKNADVLLSSANKVGDGCQTHIESHAIALIENGYFLELKCGQIQRCFQLDNPCFQNEFSFEIVGLFGTNSLEQFAVISIHTSDESECLTVDLQNKKVAHQWVNTGYVLTGDLIRRGKPQLLVLFSDWSFEPCSGSWLLTDFGATQIDTREPAAVASTHDDSDSSSSVETVVKALAGCLQKSKISLQEEEKDLYVKKQFVLSAWNRLHQRNLGNDSTGCSDQMVPMVTLVDGGHKSEKPRTSQLSPRIQIDTKQVWQFVIGEKWVVGVTAVNQSQRPISDCVLSLVSPSYQSTKQVSHWPVISGDTDTTPSVVRSLHSTAKRLKMDVGALPLKSREKKIVHRGQSATVACCMDIPVITSQKEIVFSVILHCVEVKESSSLDFASGEIVSLCCGEVTFNVQDYIDGKYAVDLTNKLSVDKWDLVHKALECVQMSEFLKVCSTFSELGSMKSLLTEQAGFTYHQELQSYICRSRDVLNFVRIQICEVKSSKEVILRVSARDENQILLLVQYLYSCLPDDIVILPSNERRTQNIIQNAMSCMAEEIEWAVSGSQALLSADDDTSTAESGAVSQNSGVDVSTLQEAFKEQQCKAQNKSKGYVPEEKFNEFCRQLQMLQFKTDKSFSYVEKL